MKHKLAWLTVPTMLAVAAAGAGIAEAQPQPPVFKAPAKAQSGGSGYAPPGGGWGPVSQSSSGLTGYPGFGIVYSYTSRSDASPIHATAKHFTNQNGGDPGPERWTEFGAGTSDKSGPLPWGDTVANPAMRFQSVNALGAIVDWS